MIEMFFSKGKHDGGRVARDISCYVIVKVCFVQKLIQISKTYVDHLDLRFQNSDMCLGIIIARLTRKYFFQFINITLALAPVFCSTGQTKYLTTRIF